nr:MAG TPA: Protein of unknown function (DUF3918) [Caudoviricetes sp.]
MKGRNNYYRTLPAFGAGVLAFSLKGRNNIFDEI